MRVLDNRESLWIGLDVGSTTVKAVVLAGDSLQPLWSGYRRHGARQAETVVTLLEELEQQFPIAAGSGADSPFQIAVTGSGGSLLAPLLGCSHVQEVNALAIAAEALHPGAGCLVELGGQDAKIILFDPLHEQADSANGRHKLLSMNDKCAGGTGAVIDKIRLKLGLDEAGLAQLRYSGTRRHPVAAKCGVFAETDINGLQKNGVPADELMVSLLDALVTQNLNVLARGFTLSPEVLLLGGPHRFLPALREAWRRQLAELWREQGVGEFTPEQLAAAVYCPEHALFYPAIGAVLFQRQRQRGALFAGTLSLRHAWQTSDEHASGARSAAGGCELLARSPSGLVQSDAELSAFKVLYSPQGAATARVLPQGRIPVYLGVDAGSTSTKAVALSVEGDLLARSYRLSAGDPVADCQQVLQQLHQQFDHHGSHWQVLGVGVTGYAKALLGELIGADVTPVETVAHARAGLHYHPDTDLIIDVGGQDIKLIMLQQGRVEDFVLNNQCAAGNGYFLQATADALGVPVSGYADAAFRARRMPSFGYGCSVFMQSDLVNFQAQGWSPDEIMAGLAASLPQNIWRYVANHTHLPSLGRRFLLQGGTHHNLAVVKAQVDYIRAQFGPEDGEPVVRVHRYCGESGAIGAALQARDETATVSRFIGMQRLQQLRYRSRNSEETRCSLCTRFCSRTFVAVDSPVVELAAQAVPAMNAAVAVVAEVGRSGAALAEQSLPALGVQHELQHEQQHDPQAALASARVQTREFIVGHNCDKGALADGPGLKAQLKALRQQQAETPNLVEWAARAVFERWAAPKPMRARISLWRGKRRIVARSQLRLGLPRTLYLYRLAPFFRAYFEALGIGPEQLVFSAKTSERLYQAGAKKAANDPCFPAKLALSHVHDLLYRVHGRKPLDWIFYPLIDDLPSQLVGRVDSRGCPTATISPDVVKAGFKREQELFAQRGVSYFAPLLNMAQPALLERQLFATFSQPLRLSRREHRAAVLQGLDALACYEAEAERRGMAILRQLEAEQRIGIVVLGRSYHHDAGVHHQIPDAFAQQGYPILSQDTLPRDPAYLRQLQQCAGGGATGEHPLSIQGLWKHSYSDGSNQKLWAAQVAAWHPNLVALDLSSFKCGHDAPINHKIEALLRAHRTPYFSFRELDENRPSGSLAIRIETILHCLQTLKPR